MISQLAGNRIAAAVTGGPGRDRPASWRPYRTGRADVRFPDAANRLTRRG